MGSDLGSCDATASIIHQQELGIDQTAVQEKRCLLAEKRHFEFNNMPG